MDHRRHAHQARAGQLEGTNGRDTTVEGARMRSLIVQVPKEKRTRLKLVAKARKVTVTKLIEEMATILWQTSTPRLASNCAPRAGESRKDLRYWTKQRGNEPARSAFMVVREGLEPSTSAL